MRGRALAVCVFLTMVTAGCLGPATASWGSGSSSVEVSFAMDDTTVKSTLTGASTTSSDLVPVGCTPGTEGGSLAPGNGTEVTFEGYLAASQLYDSHDEITGARGLDFGVTTAVGIEEMPFAQAASIEDGDGSRVNVKNWGNPLMPQTGAGTADLDDLDSESSTSWFILGLIPVSENVLNGMKALNEWHQPVSISGYLVSANATKEGLWSSLRAYEVGNDCSMEVGSTNYEKFYVLVTSIELEGGTVSLDGEADDEWVHGDVPLIGRTLFVLLFLVGGVGGFVGAYVTSSRMVLKSATKTMAILVGSEGMEKAGKVSKDAAAAKEAGMESPTERKARMDRERREREGQTERTKPPKKAKKEEESTDAGLGDFDLDSVLASAGVPSKSSGPSTSSGRSSSVVVTDAAANMDRMQASEAPVSSAPRSTGPPQQRGGPPQRSSQPSAVRNEPEAATSSPPVRRKRVAKKAKPAAPEPVAERPPSHDEDEDSFSDFSF